MNVCGLCREPIPDARAAYAEAHGRRPLFCSDRCARNKANDDYRHRKRRAKRQRVPGRMRTKRQLFAMWKLAAGVAAGQGIGMGGAEAVLGAICMEKKLDVVPIAIDRKGRKRYFEHLKRVDANRILNRLRFLLADLGRPGNAKTKREPGD